ncbi:Crp/Fnr family transcriptional regulator [Chryseobacterium indologenes]|uniref:Crp/Fnr family transcriptional regulator n=1 Tax=Chryseobacterium indologenes TaxID=253 RepID=UPI000B51724F|nr:Crp/Fnr family transcriptional regulator [Chryseobacterium indologenes]ASE60752.1 Crp/Fnr family transcriptional regulator [Chryseobacterium indologenes]ATN04814.1 Crp/Fnr family transcriptional regulator [Chryseobacterium indologenes]UDQ53015.1 Crp/Fnr family transcriptional regulator [Chryseobacterium indologenes]VFA40216.1 Cyclic nucleotide-binding domain [Chryseobacterium indologenes]HAO28621.1 Crp/Fnr family transcriptional regulator [Chryseobacterium indologenes]
MDKSSINNYFHSLFTIKDEVVEKITRTFTSFELKANDILLNQNVISTKTYFLEKGYVRSYILNEDNEEITTNIYSAPCFVNDFLSFFRQQPTKEIYQTVTDSVFWETGLENVQDNFHNVPEFREFSRLLFVLNYYNIHDRLIEMASQKALTRYSNLMKKDPDIFQHVPLKIIASYLGIKDSSLSRIRREINK